MSDSKKLFKDCSRTLSFLDSVIDNLPDAIYIKDNELKYIFANKAYCEFYGKPKEDILGKTVHELFPPEQADNFTKQDQSVLVNKTLMDVPEVTYSDASGGSHIVTAKKAPLIDAEGNVSFIVGVTRDITELKKTELEKIQAIKERDEAISKLTTPLVEIWEGIILVPLIGIIDSYRAKQITESLLNYIAQARTGIVIMDISGISDVDTKTASHILQTIQAVKLMGSEFIITGISPDVASTLVTLGIDLSEITTRRTLHEGLEYAFRKTGLTITAPTINS